MAASFYCHTDKIRFYIARQPRETAEEYTARLATQEAASCPVCGGICEPCKRSPK